MIVYRKLLSNLDTLEIMFDHKCLTDNKYLTGSRPNPLLLTLTKEYVKNSAIYINLRDTNHTLFNSKSMVDL